VPVKSRFDSGPYRDRILRNPIALYDPVDSSTNLLYPPDTAELW
jgi:hypothetical protein